VLLSISGGSDLGLFEINEAAQLVSEAAHPEANIIFGAVIDDALGDEVRVTVIAAGFDGGQPPTKGSRDKVLGSSYTAREDTAPVAPARPDTPRPAPSFGGLGSIPPAAPAERAPEPEPAAETSATPVTPPVVPPARPYHQESAEELDVPDFLK
jgi:cell division protein FtsZ